MILTGLISIKINKYYIKLVFLILYICSLYPHPFGLYFLPAVIVVLWGKYVLLAYSIIGSYFTLKLWNFQLFQCSDNRINELNNSFNINPLNILSNPLEFLESVYSNITLDRLTNIVDRITINSDYTRSANYLPAFKVGEFYIIISNYITVALFLISIMYAIYFSISNLCAIKKINKEKIYTLCILFGTTAHMLLNKTNAFYAVNFWYFIYIFIFFKEISSVQTPGFIKYKKPVILLIILFGLAVNINILSNTLKHEGPNLNLINNYYSHHYRKMVINEFEKCCNDEQKTHFAIDDAAYFILKNKVQLPVPITYAAVFGNQTDIYKERNIKFMIAKCDYIKANYGKNIITEVDGGLSGNNICINKLF
jgi:hypothetical protein